MCTREAVFIREIFRCLKIDESISAVTEVSRGKVKKMISADTGLFAHKSELVARFAKLLELYEKIEYRKELFLRELRREINEFVAAFIAGEQEVLNRLQRQGKLKFIDFKKEEICIVEKGISRSEIDTVAISPRVLWFAISLFLTLMNDRTKRKMVLQRISKVSL